MAAAHRNTDLRSCGATTIVSGQSTVFVNGKLWAVEGDQNSHGAGNLIAGGSTVTINNKKVIVQGNSAIPDNNDDVNPSASSGSGNVTAY